MTQMKSKTTGENTALEQAVRHRVESLAYLPTTAAVAMKFMELSRNLEAEPAEYARVISADASLCTKLLSLANSSWFGVRNRVTKAQMAISLLGLGTVRTLAISYCLTGLHNELRLTSDEARMFWSSSLCKAVAARQYAAMQEKALCDEAFTAGLFQDFALPVMYSVAKEKMLKILEDGQLPSSGRLQEERALFRLDHAEIGRTMAQKLELPDLFVDCVAFHHNYASLRELCGSATLADAVYVASLFPHHLNVWNPKDMQELRAFLLEHTREKPLDMEEFLETVEKEHDQLYGYFEQGGTPETKLVELWEAFSRDVADSTTQLVGTVYELLQQTANAGQEVHQLMKQQTHLEEVAARDPLTGLLNRDGLDARSKGLLDKARRYGIGIGLVYLDIDRFKVLNDTYGHPCGDRALQKVAELLRGSVRQHDVVARVGGDEFVMVLTECAQEDAIRVVQRAVQNVANKPVAQSGTQQAQATISAGFLWVPRGSTTYELNKLLPIADRLMYDAKRAGGSQVKCGVAPAIVSAKCA